MRLYQLMATKSRIFYYLYTVLYKCFRQMWTKWCKQRMFPKTKPILFFTEQNAVREQKRNVNQINIWYEQPLASKQHHFFMINLLSL